MTKHDLIDSIAQQRTDNAEISELETVYYQDQFEKLEDYSIDELIDTYKDYFDDYEEGDLEDGR